MADFMLERKGLAQNMSADEVAAFRWFYADAMANKTRLINDLKDFGSKNDSFDSPEVAHMMRDLRLDCAIIRTYCKRSLTP